MRNVEKFYIILFDKLEEYGSVAQMLRAHGVPDDKVDTTRSSIYIGYRAMKFPNIVSMELLRGFFDIGFLLECVEEQAACQRRVTKQSAEALARFREEKEKLKMSELINRRVEKTRKAKRKATRELYLERAQKLFGL